MQTVVVVSLKQTLIAMFGYKGGSVIVKDIIKLACTYLQMDSIKNSVLLGGDSEVSGDDQYIVDSLLECVNLTNNVLASEYIKLYKTKVVETTDGIVPYYKLVDGVISPNQIISVKDGYGNKLIYKLFDSYIKTVTGSVEVTYTYIPSSVTIDDTIDSYPLRLSERIYAYGVASEYSFINGMYEDAIMWDERFKNSLLNVTGPKGQVSIKKRRWL